MSNLKQSLTAMRAVARVRDIREKESRRALQHALATQRAHAQHVTDLQDYLVESGSLPFTDATAFTAHRSFLLTTGHALTEAKEHEQVAAEASAQALGAWQHDKTQINAVEMLIERRVEETRKQAARLEAAQLDEIASAQWARQNTASQTPGGDAA